MRNLPFPLNRRAFTLMEALFAFGMGSIFLVSAMSTWVYTTKTWKEESVRSELRLNTEKALEKMKEDIRLSDGGKINFYPVGSSTYTAVGMPREYANSNGLYDYTTAVTWQDTIIYHVNNNVLKRTKVAYNAASATRQAQVDSAATTGSVTGGTTTNLFSANSITLGLTPTSPEFDGYGSPTDLSANTSFGTIQLTPGSHTVRFEVTGKNTLSTGYRLGLDSIALTPSGADREAEALPSSISGGSQALEDMSSFTSALWGGNYQREFQAGAVGNYIDFTLYNDAWIESNFANLTHTSTEVTGTDPVLTVASRENQGLSPNWRADLQTGAVETDLTGMNGKTIRCVVHGSQFARASTMVRFKFKAAAAGAGQLRITSAYVGLEDTTSPGNLMPGPTQLYFANPTMSPGDVDGVGAMGTAGNPDVTIGIGEYVWSNWVILPIGVPSTSNYLVSFATHNGAGNGSETEWDQGGGGTMSYTVNGDHPLDSWNVVTSAGYDTDPGIHAVAEMQSWYHIGTGTSQIYDTKMTNPAYGTVSWDTNGSGTYAVKVRSSNSAQMIGATAWTALGSYGSSPSAIAGAGNGRYVQFQAQLTAASPYTTYPEMDDLVIQWPGATTLCELSGYFTKRPNYGKFKVKVDGVDVVSALELNMEASKTFQGKTQSVAIGTETKPRNTGK